MFKKALWTLLLPVIMLSLIVCSKLNPYTSAGSDIINTIDPSLTDFNGNFLAYTQDQSMVTDSTVIPGANTYWLKKQKDTLAVGFTFSKILRTVVVDSTPDSVSNSIIDTLRDTLLGLAKSYPDVKRDTVTDTIRQKIQAAGNIQFSVSAQTLKNFKATDSVTSVTFIFDTLTDTTQFYGKFNDPGADLKLYSCSKAIQDTPFVVPTYLPRTTGAKLLGSPAAKTITKDTAKKTTFTDYQLSVTDTAFLSAAQHACRQRVVCADPELKADTNLAARCSRTEPDSIFHLTMFNNDESSMLRFKGARMIISHQRDTAAHNDTLYKDTISGGMSTVYWTQYRQTTVFEVNLLPLWESLSKNNFPEILSAAFILPEKLTITPPDSDSVATLYYYLSEVPYSADTATDRKIDAATKRYQSSKPITGQAADSLILPVDFFLQQMSAEKPASAYLYLQTYNKNGTRQDISLNKPRFRAVFTTFR